jgi:hypothetical protein
MAWGVGSLLVVGAGVAIVFEMVISGTWTEATEAFARNTEATAVLGTPASLADRLGVLLSALRNSSRGALAQISVIGDLIGVADWIYPTVFLVSQLLALVTVVSRRIKGVPCDARMWFLGVILMVSFCCVAMVFGNRIREHHFISLFVVSFFTLGCGLSLFASSAIKWGFRVWGPIVCLLMVPLVAINCLDYSRFMTSLRESGGVRLYTEELNHLPSRALAEARAGNETFYLFPEWGFFMNFAYLTENRVPYAPVSPWPDLLTSISRDFDRIVLCYWEKDRRSEYESAFAEAGLKPVVKTWLNRQGDRAFYFLEWEGGR